MNTTASTAVVWLALVGAASLLLLAIVLQSTDRGRAAGWVRATVRVVALVAAVASATAVR